MDQLQGIVIDNGSCSMKSGFSGDDAPRSIFATLIGKPKSEEDHNQACFVGDDAVENCIELKLNRPIERGLIKDWTDMENLWNTVYSDLNISPEEHPVLVTEALNTPKSNRERLLSIFFETYNVPAFYVAVQPVLAMYASAKTSGVIIDVGDGLIQCVALYEGYVTGKQRKVNLGGRDITEYLYEILTHGEGYSAKRSSAEILNNIEMKYKHQLENTKMLIKEQFENFLSSEEVRYPPSKAKEVVERFHSTIDTQLNGFMTHSLGKDSSVKIGLKNPGRSYDFLLTNKIKEDIGYVSSDYQSEVQRGDCDIEHELPDGSTLKIGTERFRVPEILFTPSLLGRECKGVHELVYEIVQSCEMNYRGVLYQNIVMSGGSTLFEGIEERMNLEMVKQAPKNAKIKVHAASERKCSVWVGGSILSSLSTFSKNWVTKSEFEDTGPSIVHKKCFLQ